MICKEWRCNLLHKLYLPQYGAWMQLDASERVKHTAHSNHKRWHKYHLFSTELTFPLFTVQSNGKFKCACRWWHVVLIKPYTNSQHNSLSLAMYAMTSSVQLADQDNVVLLSAYSVVCVCAYAICCWVLSVPSGLMKTLEMEMSNHSEIWAHH